MKCLICNADDSEFVTAWEQWRFERCRNCSVLFTAPLAEEEVVQRYTSGSILESPGEPAPTSELIFPAWKHREHARIVNRLAALGTRQGRLLDVGCLWGSFLGYAHQSGFDVTGIEPFGKAATYVKEVLKLNASQGTLRSAAFPAGSFDCIFNIRYQRPDGGLRTEGRADMTTRQMTSSRPNTTLSISPSGKPAKV